jgi:E1A/CREB-binding protein
MIERDRDLQQQQQQQHLLPVHPEDVVKGQRWLLFMRHCARCRKDEEQCALGNQCAFGKQLWAHLLGCNKGNDCDFLRCSKSKGLINHHYRCTDAGCALCVPVRGAIRLTTAAQAEAVEQS